MSHEATPASGASKYAIEKLIRGSSPHRDTSEESFAHAPANPAESRPLGNDYVFHVRRHRSGAMELEVPDIADREWSKG
jgi:hypothetical protein